MPSPTITPLSGASPITRPGSQAVHKARFRDRSAAKCATVLIADKGRSNWFDAMESDCPSDYDRPGNTAVTSFTAMQAVLAAAFLALCPPVQAQSVSPEPTQEGR